MLASTQRRGLLTPANLRLLALLVPVGLLGGAMGSQYIGGLAPCEMCYWQRWPHAAAILLALLAFSAPAHMPRARLFTLLAALAIAISGLIGVYHVGVELDLYEGVTSCAAGSGATSIEDIMAEINGAPLVRCDEVQWSFLGISMAGWNALISLGTALVIALGLGKKCRR